ncbi:MAG: endolytic transglycosylase MltG [Clostridia bacterium]|nr:endolytic transglycosylase MltG [Clostridia bacterium]
MANSRKPVADDFDMLISNDDEANQRRYDSAKSPSTVSEKRASSSVAKRPSQTQKAPQKKTSQTSSQSGIRKPGQRTNPVNKTEPAKSDLQRRKELKTKKAAQKEKSYRNMKKSRFSRGSTAAMVFLSGIVLIAIGVFSAFVSYTYLVDKYENPITADSIEIDEATAVEFKIEKGSRTESIADELKEQGLIKNKFIFKMLSKFNGYDDLYKSGVHILCKDLTYDEIMVLLADEPLTVSVMFPEGFTTIQIAERLEANDIVGKEEFLEAVDNIDLSSYSFVPQEKGEMDYRLDGYLFPDTYKFEIDSNPETVIYKMLNRFSDVFKPEYYERAEKQGLTVNQVVTIASYVEKECKVGTERETIARLFYNRMHSETVPFMECPSTLQYIVKRNTGESVSEITEEMKFMKDRYNTFMYEGLTPGAICSPGQASIKAVIEMNEHDYLYYTLKKDGNGTHVFSVTAEEHDAAVKENAS